MRTFSLLVAVFALFTIGLYAAGVDGKWEAEVKTPDGTPIPLTLNLKADGDKLTGSISGPTGDIAISDGKLDGDTIAFSIAVDANGQQMSFKCSGKISADSLNMTMDGGDLKLEFTAKRSAS